MALRETQHATEVYDTGGERHQVTQHAIEVYDSGGESFLLTQHAVEVYASVEVVSSGRTRAFIVGL